MMDDSKIEKVQAESRSPQWCSTKMVQLNQRIVPWSAIFLAAAV